MRYVILLVPAFLLGCGLSSPYRPQVGDTYPEMCARLDSQADVIDQGPGWAICRWYPWKGSEEWLVWARFEGDGFLSGMVCTELHRNNHVWEQLAPRTATGLK